MWPWKALFSNMSGHSHHLEGLLSTDLGPMLRVSDSVSLGATQVLCSLEMLLLLVVVQQPHSENRWSGG